MKRILFSIVAGILAMFLSASPSHATRVAPGFQDFDRCRNIAGFQGITEFIYGRWTYVGPSGLHICVRRYHPAPVACYEVVKRGGEFYCRTGRGLRNPCALDNGSDQYALNAARACDENRYS